MKYWSDSPHVLSLFGTAPRATTVSNRHLFKWHLGIRGRSAPSDCTDLLFTMVFVDILSCKGDALLVSVSLSLEMTC